MAKFVGGDEDNVHGASSSTNIVDDSQTNTLTPKNEGWGTRLLKANPAHRSLHFKKAGRFWSVRVGLRHRAWVLEANGECVWFWIGSYAEYDKLAGRRPANPHFPP
ncbi:MAG TPA: hypothetical protein VIG89_04625 [Candidatus Acidoferrales bacterium]